MKEKNTKAKTPNKKAIGLTTKIFIALIAGAILGIILCYLVPDSSFKKDVIIEGILYVIGQGFIRLMKMLVVPLVFCSLICGSMAIGDTKKLGTVGVRTLAFYLATTALAVCVALGVGNLINPGVGLDMSAIQSSAASVETMEATSLTDTILNIIPDNPINSLASGTMLQVIVFALIVGVILAKMGERAETVANFFSQFNDIMMEMTMMIMSLAPIGVFCLISRTFANIGFSAIPWAIPGTDSPSLKLTLESIAPVGTNRTRFHWPVTMRGRINAASTEAAQPQPLPPECVSCDLLSKIRSPQS